MQYTIELHKVEKYGLYECWLSGSKSEMFGALSGTHCAMSQSQIEAYTAAVIAKAGKLSQDYINGQPTKVNDNGQPVFYTINIIEVTK